MCTHPGAENVENAGIAKYIMVNDNLKLAMVKESANDEENDEEVTNLQPL